MYQASIRKQWGITYLILNSKVYCHAHNSPLLFPFLGTSVHALLLLFFKMYFNITPIYTWDFLVISFLLGPCPDVHTIFYLSCVCRPSHLAWFGIPNYCTTYVHICQQLAKIRWFCLHYVHWSQNGSQKVAYAQFMLLPPSVYIGTQEYKKYHVT
jgi:hypothetical protein